MKLLATALTLLLTHSLVVADHSSQLSQARQRTPTRARQDSSKEGARGLECIPTPGGNRKKCTDDTSCTFITGTGKHYCACAGGFKGDADDLARTGTESWRLPWQGQEYRVFVAPRVKCNTPYDYASDLACDKDQDGCTVDVEVCQDCE